MSGLNSNSILSLKRRLNNIPMISFVFAKTLLLQPGLAKTLLKNKQVLFLNFIVSSVIYKTVKI